MTAEGPLDRAARPLLAFAADLAGGAGRELAPALREAGALLDRFARDAARAGPPAPAIPALRLALALVLDDAARHDPRLDRRAWSAGALRLLFDGEPMTEARLRDFAARAHAAGPPYAEAAAFLDGLAARLAAGHARAAPAPDGFARTALSAALGFALLVLAWAVQEEWAFHRSALAGFDAEAVSLGLDRRGAVVADLPVRLDRLAGAQARLEASAAAGPLRPLARLLRFDAADRAARTLADARALTLPPVLSRAMDEALASEGDSLRLYDTLRALAMLRGEAPWQPAFVAGWLGDRAALLPDLQGLVPQVAALGPPGPSWGAVAEPDPVILAQSRGFAAAAPEGGRAWLELARAPAMAALPPWRPDRAVPGLDRVFERRSGLPLSHPLPGAFTRAGWALARDGGAEAAVATARAEALRLFGRPLPQDPGSAGEALARLQDATLEAWRALLADLRVRPLLRRDDALEATGLLARADSPLRGLLLAAWAESGGGDRDRPAELQGRIGAALGPSIAYVERGGLDRIAVLLAGLNTALGAEGGSAQLREARLRGVQDRAASVAELDLAPPLVADLVTDVLAQTAASAARPAPEGRPGAPSSDLANPVTAAWQAEALPLCREALEGRFPFAGAEGPDADPLRLAELLGPGGALARFVGGEAAAGLDTASDPWRWRAEARFEGLSPDSAALLQRLSAAGGALFGETGGLGASFTVAALAERGAATLSVGGVEASLAAGATLAWPGPDPGAGARVAFGGAEAAAFPGPWGLLRLLAPRRLRLRDEGRRVLVDLRGGDGRTFLEMGFASPANPVSALPLLEGLACPGTL